MKVNVRHNKETHPVEFEADAKLADFQAQLFSLTSVPPDRQKLMHKSRMVKTDDDVKKFKAGDTVVLISSAEVLQAPTKKIVFEEDLSGDQRSRMSLTNMIGLKNLENTCYMNSTLQCLRACAPLKEALYKYATQNIAGMSHDLPTTFTASLGLLLRQLDSSKSTVTPSLFTESLRTLHKQFGERSEKTGHYMQQDADECLVALLNTVAEKIGKNFQPMEKDSKSLTPLELRNVVDYAFGFEVEVKMKVKEPAPQGVDIPPESNSKEVYRKFRCAIDDKVNYMYEGVLKDMDEEVERKISGLPILFTKQTRMLRLPRYLVVQFVRFDYRQDTKQKSKKLRRVQYPLDFDVFQYTAASLKSALTHNRNVLQEEKDKAMGLGKDNKKKDAAGDKKGEKKDTKKTEKASTEKKVEKSTEKKVEKTKAEGDMDTTEDKSPPKEYDLSVCGPSSGHYKLFGVVTHQGRTADSGHYIGWVHEKDDAWVKYDDEVVTPVQSDDIMKLSGGGDWHMAYLLMYKRSDDLTEPYMRQVERKAKEAHLAASKVADSTKTQT